MASPRSITRIMLGSALIVAGVTHLTVARREFQGQVPPWVPIAADTTVVASGAAEITLGSALILAPARPRPWVGAVVAAFFVAIFPGNISQWAHDRSAFGLDTDGKRFARLFFQPALVVASLWATGRDRT